MALKAALVASAFALPLSTALATYRTTNTSIDPNDFIYVDGLRLKDSKGLHYVTGLNYWGCMNLAADASQGGNYTRLVTELDQMAAKGVNHLRIMAASEGAPTRQPFRMNPALLDAPGVYNEKVFEGLDICLDEMSKRGMRATMTLNNEWQWSGGFAQYVSWANGDEEIPYPPSWNLTAPPQRETPRTGWGAYTVAGIDAKSYAEFMAYANLFYSDVKAEEIWKDHIKTVMSRRNTINGRLYTEDATIMSWQLANEPQPEESLGFEGPYGKWYKPNPNDLLIPWVERISDYIRTMAPKQLISVGMESKQGPWYFEEVHKFPNVDYTTAHCWVQNWGIYDMYDPTGVSLLAAQNFAKDFIRDTNQWSVEVGKPIILEEFGMARDNWENALKEYAYLSSAGTTHKDAYFRTIIGAAMDEFKNQGAYVGTAPWAYGGVWRPETQYVDDFGMVWAGDPPHESPGWYDLYDTDEAMNIIAEQQKDIAAWIKSQGYPGKQ